MGIASAERRQFGRVESSTRGWIIVPDRPPLQCIVRNLSLQGALLEVKLPPWLPRAFRLEVESARLKTYCEVRHTSEGAIGVKFVEGLPLQQQPPAFQAGQPAPASSAGVERRYFGRRDTHYTAWINVPGRPRLACVVKDLSVGGALLELEKPSWLPYSFQLMIEATRFISMCEVRRQTDKGVGVRFLAAVEQSVIDRRRASDNRSIDDRGAWEGGGAPGRPRGP